MYTRWTQHLSDQKEKDAFVKKVYSSKPVLERLIRILREEDQIIDSQERNIKDFDIPNWENKQAFRNGMRAEIGALIHLIDLDQQKDINIQ